MNDDKIMTMAAVIMVIMLALVTIAFFVLLGVMVVYS